MANGVDGTGRRRNCTTLWSRRGLCTCLTWCRHPLVDDALKVINAQLLSENSMEYNNLGHLVLAGGVGHSDEIKRLLYASPAYTLAQRLVGKGQLTTCRLLFACLRARLLARLLAARPLGCLPISTCQLPLRPAKPSRRRADSAARPRARHPAHDGRQELAH